MGCGLRILGGISLRHGIFNFNLILRPFLKLKLHFAASIYPSSPGPLSPALVSSGSCPLDLPGSDFFFHLCEICGRPYGSHCPYARRSQRDCSHLAENQLLNVTTIATLASWLVWLIVVGGA